MKLHTYFRSSAAFRVRIALGLKGLEYDPVFVRLAEGEQKAADYLAQNPQGLIPALDTGDELLSQSLAIIEYLDLQRPIFKETASGGHFGRDGFSWESTHRAAELAEAAGLTAAATSRPVSGKALAAGEVSGKALAAGE